jgi:hypothetical protein
MVGINISPKKIQVKLDTNIIKMWFIEIFSMSAPKNITSEKLSKMEFKSEQLYITLFFLQMRMRPV